jgi:two-component system cell cycle sensor histidine kinase PleC
LSLITTREVSPVPFAAVAQGAHDMVRYGWKAVYASLHPSEEEAWLADAQLRLYRQGTQRAGLILAGSAFVIGELCVSWVAVRTCLLWSFTVAAIGVGLYLIGRNLDRHANDSVASVRLRARGYLALTVVFVTAFGSMSVFLWSPGEPFDHILIVAILACGLAGSITVSAVHSTIGFSGFAIYTLFLVGPLVASHTRLDHMLAWLTSVFAAMMGGQLVALHSHLNRMLRLEHERAGLVENLHQSKAQSDRESARAAQAARVKSQFLSNMSHELRTPMNAILGFSELIKSRAFGANIDRCVEYAEIIHDSGRHLLTLIDGVLDLGKIEGGRLSLRESNVDLVRIVGDALESHRQGAEAARVSVAASFSRDFPMLRADERAMTQIVANLLANGIKFTPPEGCVTAFARREPDGGIAFGVEDTGIGIADTDQPDVFERFGNNRHDVTTADRGMGLGLAIVKGLSEAHDGRVELESALGSGTRVTVYLPADRVIGSSALKFAG